MAETSPLSALDRHAVRRAAAMIALELSARRRVVAAERDSHAALVSDLIRGDRDPGWLAQRGRELDVDLAAPHIVCLLAGPDGGPPPDPGAVAVALAGHLGGAPAPGAALADATAVLLPVPEAASRAATAFARGAVADALAGLPGVVAALSDPVTRPEDVPHAYDEAVQVLACLRAHAGGPARVLAVHDLGAARLLLASLDREHADRFADHKLGPLLAHGSSEELLETLETFFACGRGIRTAAAALGVHENTIRYRLGKVADLCALDVIGDADDQTTALLALRVLQLAGRRPWPAPATAGAA
jgi:sugar diacid utilization regulator